jgi:isoleucyl-tRNA synthetase
MTFKEVPNKIDFVAQEHAVLAFWDKSQSLAKLRSMRNGAPKWSFIDGPITANNPMGVHHGWGRTYKDLYNRYFAMRGHELRYQQGFDCQGLWVEVEVEKELEFGSKKDIEEYGLDKFVLRCKERVLRFAAVQTEQSQRLGYWMEWNDPDNLRDLGEKLLDHDVKEITYQGPAGEMTGSPEQIVGQLGMPQLGGSYFTFSDENNYMIWSFLKKTWEKGWLYRGADSMPWCPRCATAISQHEIVTDGYQTITHDSVTIRFPLRGREKESLLVWTTTPWTLTSNVVAAVGPELDYVKVRQGDEFLYLSKGTLGMLQGEHEIVEELKGKDMEGWTYDGPFDELPASQLPGGKTELSELVKGVRETAAEVHRVILWDDVGEDEGTGIVHIAPGAGADDFRLGKEHGLPLIAPLDEEGVILDDFGWLSGLKVADAAKPIFDNLDEKGLLYRVAPYEHRYPTCWRCKTELVFRTVDEWFINMGDSYEKPREKLTKKEKEASLRYQIMDSVDQIRWVPEFGHAREMDWLRNMHDWMISKKRYWGLALPIWVCDDCDEHTVIGDEKELKERAVEGWDQFEGHAPHRPHIDAVKLKCEACDGLMTRIPDVGNPWLDAGIVPFSTLRYREDPDYWKKWYPADWISESFPGQFRNWFYSVLAMGTVMDGGNAFDELFGYALLLAEDGSEMHKSTGNMVEFNEAADKMGVDVMRWLYCAHKPENNLLFGYERADETRRRVLIPLWNVYSFLATYARLDEWSPTWEKFDPDHPEGPTPQSDNPLDQWILARLNQVVALVTKALDETDAFAATLAVEPLIDDITNWYVRRSRRRFWRSEHDSDKAAAYTTLHHVLVKLVRLIAPFMPFVTEEIYQNLVVDQVSASETSAKANSKRNRVAHSSIHHTLFPLPDDSAIDTALIEEMGLARQIASLGLSARGNVGLKVRQPLAKVLVHTSSGISELSAPMVEIVKDELNVKNLQFSAEIGDLVQFTLLPDNAKLGPRFGADFPKLRAALSELDPIEVKANLDAAESVELKVGKEKVVLAPDEILVNSAGAEGLAVASEKAVTVAVDTELTAELKAEGQAREIVRRIQDMRKNADFNIEDRIRTYYMVEGELAAVFGAWADYIKAETLSEELLEEDAPKEAYSESQQVDGVSLRIGLVRLKA